MAIYNPDPIRSFARAKFEAAWASTTRSNYSGRRRERIALLRSAVAALLLGWPLEDLDEAAWVFALDGWQRTPPLVQEYDFAFEKLSELLLDIGEHDQPAGLDSLKLLLGELRERAQFLQTRAADIRLSNQLDRLVAVGMDRLVPTFERLVDALSANDPRGAVAQLDATQRLSLLLAVATLVRRVSPTIADAAVGAATDPRIIEMLKRIASVGGGVLIGVLPNYIWEAIKTLCEHHGIAIPMLK